MRPRTIWTSPPDDDDDEALPVAFPAERQSFHARRAHAAAYAGVHSRAHAHQYKKIMIPFLIVMAALLVLVGAYSASEVLGADERTQQLDSYARMTMVMIASFPLAAVLGFGAWWFHRDVKGS